MPLSSPERSDHLVPAVDRAMRVLDVLETEGHPLGISELARRLGGSKSQMLGVLETLRRHGLLERDEPTKHYRLGGKLVRLGQAALVGRDVIALARPWLGRLAAETGESVALLIPSGDRALILDKAEAGEPAVRVSVPVGLRIPLEAGAVGKAFFAFASRTDDGPSRARHRRFTARSITEPAAYHRELLEVRRRGYAIDDEEYLDGVRAAAAPVFDSLGSVVAAVLVVGLTGSFGADRFESVGEAVARAAMRISSELGAARGI
jgi:IclR family transcriptional regulator, KDG regulon repressor